MKNPSLAVIHMFGQMPDHLETDLFPFSAARCQYCLQKTVRGCVLFMGVCMCRLHTHTDAGMGKATRSAHAPHREQVKE